MTKIWAFVLLICVPGVAAAGNFDAQGWELVEPDLQIQFPRDYGPHFNFRTEWWYFGKS